MTKLIAGWGRCGLAACGLAVAAWLLAGCQTGSDTQFAEIPGVTTVAPAYPAASPGAGGGPAISPLGADGSFDTIRVGDYLTITFSDLPYLQAPIDERVKEDGTITLIQNQTFVAAGKTRSQLEKEIRERYVPRYFVSMTVSVRHKEATQFYFVGGEVKGPGRQVFISRMTVTKAIQSAGDFTEFANKRKVKLFRSNGKVETIDTIKALKDPSLDPEIYPGDKIHVYRKIF